MFNTYKGDCVQLEVPPIPKIPGHPSARSDWWQLEFEAVQKASSLQIYKVVVCGTYGVFRQKVQFVDY